MFGFQAGGISGKDTPGREKWQFVKSKLPNEPKSASFSTFSSALIEERTGQ
jgi:hypothetical protein